MNITRTGGNANCLRIAPPLVVSEEEIDLAIEIMDALAARGHPCALLGQVTALYRKYRPQDFDEVVGQEAVVRTLKNAIAGGQVRQAYLFAGPRGTGKTSLARILAKALNCVAGPDADAGQGLQRLRDDRERHVARRRSRWTRPRSAASTTSARSATASSSSRPRAATRSTSSTRRTSSRTPPGTRS